jgi:hypothetical protein
MGFWVAITQLIELLEPVRSLQGMSEDNKLHLAMYTRHGLNSNYI